MTFTPKIESINKPSYKILEDLTQINPAQLQTLIDKLQTESAILADRLCVEDFQNLIQKNQLTLIIDINNNIIASAMLWPVENNDNWYEVGTVWVDSQHRGQGLGHLIIEDITTKIPNGKSAFLLTKSPRVIHSAGTFGYIHQSLDEFENQQFFIEPPALPEEKLFAILQTRINDTSKKLLTLRNP